MTIVSPESRVPSPESRVYREGSPSAAGWRSNRNGSHQGAGKGWGGWPGLATGVLTLGGLGLYLGGPAQANICDRTPEVQEGIFEELELISESRFGYPLVYKNCADITMNDLNMINKLDLDDRESQYLTILQENDFDGLSNLTQLYLNDLTFPPRKGSLRSLPAGILDGLYNLKTFSAYHHDLSSLNANIFDSLSNLE